MSAGTPAEKIAVVIPTLNEERLISACLASVGPTEGLEVLVSDGGSTDHTLEIVAREHANVRILGATRGRGVQLNAGFRATTAPTVLFLHADCRLPNGWAQVVRDALADTAVAIGCFRLHTEPPRDGSGGSAARAWWRLLDLRSRGLGLPYGDQALFVRRDVFDAIGGFPEIPLMEDLALVRSCLRHGRLARLPLEVRTTARRFARHPVRARVCTLTFPLLFRLGVSPVRLARWYGDPR